MSYKHLAALFLALAAPFGTLAATLDDRSPFTQGLWWDTTRPGHGFEMFNVGTTGAAIWYTYENDGRAVWYIAQGELGETWPLLKHRWSGGRHAAPETVGTLKVTVNNPESARVAFELGSSQGAWNITPFNLSGVPNEVDHSGSYFNPDNSGWGLTLTQQGDILGGVLYTYDATGAPTWYTGFDRTSNGSVAFISSRGPCPTCTPAPNVTQPAGRLTFDFLGESQLTLRSQLDAVMASGINVDGATVLQLGRKASSRPADRQLVSFPSDVSLKAFLEAGMLNVPLPNYPGGFSASPPPAAATFSTTNLSEPGVDEADLVKSDGRSIYTFTYNHYGQRQPVIRVARVDSEGASLQVAGTFDLATAEMGNAGIYLGDGQLVAVTGTQSTYPGSSGISFSAGNWVGGTTNVEIFDTSGAGLPVSTWRATIDGTVVSSRRIGNRLYLVSRFVPKLQGFTYGAGIAWNPAGYAANQSLLRATPLDKLVPKVSINGGAAQDFLDRASILIPPQGSRPPVADMAMVYAIDLPTKRIAQATAVLGGAETIYVSPGNLYVATTRSISRDTLGQMLADTPFVATDIHQFRLGADTLSLVASGSVEGLLAGDTEKASFRLSEHEGRLRAVTSTAGSMWGVVNKNRVTVLEPSVATPGLLKTVSYLPNAQRPAPLGKPGELLYGSRFAGDRLYAVTFKLIDPLYVVDLSNVADPKIAASLELPGFSEYLHPLPNGLLLGFGKDARPAASMGDGSFAWYQGLQLSLFDVSGSGSIRELQRIVIGKRGSTSALLANHRAFSSLQRSDGLTFAFPARIHDGTPLYGSGDSSMYPWKESGVLRYVLRGTGPSDARLEAAAPMITRNSVAYDNSIITDPAEENGRAILFRGATIYVGNGQFWRQDAAGTISGPF